MTEEDLDPALLSPSSARHPIGVVARRTALKPDVIRAWERRYQAILPARSAGRHRFYSDADVERLTLLRQATLGGHTISQIAHLPLAALQALAHTDQEAPAVPRPGRRPARRPIEQHVQACLAAAERLDGRELERQLAQAAADLSRPQLIEQLLVPVLQQTGELWEEGVMRPMHEHLNTAVIRSLIGKLYGNFKMTDHGPGLVATTPSGQRHEMGALFAASIAADEGWSVTYLGPDLPAEEIVAACRQKSARVLALSLIYPTDDPQLGDVLARIRRHLSPSCAILAGGRGAGAYAAELAAVQATLVPDLATLRQHLRVLRKGSQETDYS